LHLEDSSSDSELIHSLIERGGIGHDYFFAENEKDYLKILEKENIDLILSDYSLPSYNGNEALKVAREKYSHIPFIFVSGAMGEDAAINAMLDGAMDYVLKNKLERLVPAIKRALHEHELAVKHKQAEIDLKEKNEHIEAQNEKYVQIIKELAFQKEEKEKRAAELITANIQKAAEEKYKLIIEEKNKDITDSINYAKRIQQAKLPKKEEIYSALSDCFILFKPKDIVSGDFYYFYKSNKSLFIAAADCTGHGVPGAFMSMIGLEILNDAVAQNIDTSEILKHLNIGIKNSLHQSDSSESTRDGMDIAMCSVDTNKRIINYAGAKIPFWLIRNGKTEVQEIKGTRKEIGGWTEDNQCFDSHELKLQQGDTFYISTDGYPDQFGGQDGKKLMKKKFKKILLDIQDMSMQKQEKYLDNFIENWKSEAEQVDDILVIGVRL